MDLTPRQQLDGLARARVALDGSEVPVTWSGEVYAYGPDQPFRHLFGFMGVNVARLVEVDGGYEMLSREAAFFLDPRTRSVLTSWHNPFTEETVEVTPIWNDPANQRWLLDGPRGPFRIPMTHLGDQVCMHLDIPLSYPSPLPVTDFPDASAGDTYNALELFQFFVPATVFETTEVSVPMVMSWTRMSPWMPWMRMGQRPGGLVFQCRASKVTHIPSHLREHLVPPFDRAPQMWTEPNETSWTRFRRLA